LQDTGAVVCGGDQFLILHRLKEAQILRQLQLRPDLEQTAASRLQKTHIVPQPTATVSLGDIAWHGYNGPLDLLRQTIEFFSRKPA